MVTVAPEKVHTVHGGEGGGAGASTQQEPPAAPALLGAQGTQEAVASHL